MIRILFAENYSCRGNEALNYEIKINNWKIPCVLD